MSRDNWERLVVAVVKREQIWQLCHEQSRSPSVSTISSDFSEEIINFSGDTVKPISVSPLPLKTPSLSQVKQIFAKPIQLADQVINLSVDVTICKQECAELKSKTEQLTRLLWQLAQAGNEVYERPTYRIMNNAELVLDRVLALILRCRGNDIMKRLFTIIPATSFQDMSSQLEKLVADVSWLLSFCNSADYRANEYLGVPSIAANEPILCLTWELIAVLYTGSVDEKGDAAASLACLARANEQYVKLIIKEDGVGPLLKLMMEGKMEGQANAARAIGVLGKDSESVEQMIRAGVCSVLAEMLKEGPKRVQAMVAWAVSELAAHYPKIKDLFARYNIIGLLVHHLCFETVEEHSKYATVSEATSIQKAVVLASNDRAREVDDPGTEAYLKAMSGRALWQLAKGNSTICRSLTGSRTLLCFAFHLEKGPQEVRFNSAMSLMEITAVAEKDADLRRSAFKPNSVPYKAVVDKLFTIIEKEDVEILIPCIKTIGNLARTFKATETRVINPLVKLLDDREAEVSKEACVALTKFAHPDNYLCVNHSKAIVAAGGVKHLVLLAYFGEQIVQICSLILLFFIALHVPDSEELGHAEVLTVLEWATKQASLMQVQELKFLLPEPIAKLELYRSRGYY